MPGNRLSADYSRRVTTPAAPLSRRLLLAGSLSAALLGALSGCSGDDEPAPEPEASAAPAFPTTIDHVYGATTIEAEPRRIVVVGFTEQDTLLALGIAPVATTTWVGDAPYNVFEWAADKLGDAQPTVLDSTEGLQLEEIEKLEPDLILGTNAGITQEDYAELSKIAPTVANSGAYGSDYYEPWPTQTVVVGQAVGRSAQAKQLVTDLTQRFADAAAAHPQFADVPAAFVQAPYTDGSVIAWPAGLNTDFLTDLGFTIPTSLNEFVGDELAQAEIPAEDASVLDDAKVLVWGTDAPSDGADIEADPVLGALAAVKEGRSIYTGELLTSALYFNTILSMPYVLDTLVAELERILPA